MSFLEIDSKMKISWIFTEESLWSTSVGKWKGQVWGEGTLGQRCSYNTDLSGLPSRAGIVIEEIHPGLYTLALTSYWLWEPPWEWRLGPGAGSYLQLRDHQPWAVNCQHSQQLREECFKPEGSWGWIWAAFLYVCWNNVEPLQNLANQNLSEVFWITVTTKDNVMIFVKQLIVL